jgi:predicted O-methyltransferase YrrM
MSPEFRRDFTYGHEDMIETTSRLSGAVQPDSVETDLAEWKRAIESDDKTRVAALIERFLAAADERWLALAGHVAYYYLQVGEPQRAGDLYAEMVRRNPRSTEACYMAFLARLRQGDLAAARIHLSQALDCPQDLSEAMRRDARGYERLLLSDPPEGGKSPRVANRGLLHRLVERFMPGLDSRLRDLSLLIWQRRPSYLPRDFRPDRQWLVDDDEAAWAITRIRDTLARLTAARGAAPGDVFDVSAKSAETVRLYSLVKLLKPKVIVQAGAFVGYSACILAEACRSNGCGEVHCIDPNLAYESVVEPASWADDLVRALDLSQHVRFHRGTFATPVWFYGSHFIPSLDSPAVGQQVLSETGPADLIFVDADHSASSTLADLVLAASHLAPGGKILLHDTRAWRQVRIAVSTFLSENRFCLNATDGYFALPYGRRRVRFQELCSHGFDGLGMIEFAD